MLQILSKLSWRLCSDWIEEGLNNWEKYEASDNTLQAPGKKKEPKFYFNIFVAIFSGWRRLRYFDLDEHQFEYQFLAKIHKLGDQWKVIFDFKPTAAGSAGLLLCFGLDLQHYGDYSIHLKEGSTSLSSYRNMASRNVLGESMHQLSEVGKWMRFELRHSYEFGINHYSNRDVVWKN